MKLANLRQARTKIAVVAFIFWGWVLIQFVISSISGGGSVPDIAMAEFTENAEVIENLDRTAADIRLLQAIHKPEGIDYRYSIEADCHKGSFEMKYVTTEPIEWVDDKSAVEAKIHDVQIRYNGTIYASGQYFTMPLFDDLSPETIPIEEWKENLMKQAWQAYGSGNGSYGKTQIKWVCLLIGIPILLLILNIITKEPKKKEETKGTD